MHGTDATPAKTLWNSCQHGSYYFLSWHRMYLYYFERILAKIARPFPVRCSRRPLQARERC